MTRWLQTDIQCRTQINRDQSKLAQLRCCTVGSISGGIHITTSVTLVQPRARTPLRAMSLHAFDQRQYHSRFARHSLAKGKRYRNINAGYSRLCCILIGENLESEWNIISFAAGHVLSYTSVGILLWRGIKAGEQMRFGYSLLRWRTSNVGM